MWVAKSDFSGLCTWHFAPDGEHTKCGIKVPHTWKAKDKHPLLVTGTDNRLCSRCTPPKRKGWRKSE